MDTIFIIGSLGIAIATMVKVGLGTGACLFLGSFLSFVAGKGAIFGLLSGDKQQNIGVPIVAVLIEATVQYFIAPQFSINIFGHHLSGETWCWVGLAIGLLPL